MNDFNSLLDAKAAANFLALSPSTLAKLRIYGGGPRYLKLGRRVAYSREDLDAWLNQNRRSNTSEQRA
jgi:predicted DNA-binding transcriptional regulator AlpA